MRRTDHKNGTPSEARRPRLVFIIFAFLPKAKHTLDINLDEEVKFFNIYKKDYKKLEILENC